MRLWLKVIIILFITILTLLAIFVEISIAVRKATVLSFLFFLLKLSLVVFFVIDFYEAWKALVGGDATLSFQEIDKYTIGSLLDSLPGKTGFFGETSLIIKICFIAEIIDAVKELAPLSIHAVPLILVLTAELSLIV